MEMFGNGLRIAITATIMGRPNPDRFGKATVIVSGYYVEAPGLLMPTTFAQLIDFGTLRRSEFIAWAFEWPETKA